MTVYVDFQSGPDGRQRNEEGVVADDDVWYYRVIAEVKNWGKVHEDNMTRHS